MPRHSVMGDNLEKWNAETDKQIDYDRAALVCTSDHYCFRGCDLVEATIDT